MSLASRRRSRRCWRRIDGPPSARARSANSDARLSEREMSSSSARTTVLSSVPTGAGYLLGYSAPSRRATMLSRT